MKFNFWNLRQWLVFGAVFVVASFAVWFGYYQGYLQQYANRPQSHQASGVLKSMDGNKLIIFGGHINDNDINKAEDFSKRQDLTVIITPDTMLVKSVWYIPITKEYLMENKVKVDPTKIRKENMGGSIEDFKDVKGLVMTIKTENNTINKTKFNALEIGYTIFVYAK